MSNDTLKKTLLTTAATVLLGFSANAQEAQLDETGAATVEENAEEPKSLFTVTVTGTRFKNPNLSSPSPINSVTADDIRRSGRVRLEDALERIPALRETSGFGGFGDDGVSSPNLRALGSERTLAVVNGKRFVPTGVGSSIDINAIPQALIERVDVLTGGASAVYGADAVTGVVNFILKDDFEGVSLSGQYGAALENWDAAETQFSALAGTNFDNDRGNIVFGYSYTKSDSLKGTERSFTSDQAFYPRSNDEGTPSTVYVQETEANGVSDYSRQGAVIELFDGTQINGDGTPYTDGALSDNFPTGLGFYPIIIPETDAHTASLNVHYDVNDKFRPFADIYYSQTRSKNQGISGQGTEFGFIELDNAFISDALFEATLDEFFLIYNRSDFEVPIVEEGEADTLQAIFGAEGDLTDSLRYEMSANIGRNWIKRTGTQKLLDRYEAAADAVFDFDGNGNIVCRGDIDPDFAADFYVNSPITYTIGADSGCVPFNVFTTDTTVNAAAIDWIWQDASAKTTIKQDIFNGFLAGDLSPLGLSLPGGDIEFVLGAEYREASIGTKVDFFADAAVGASENSLGRNTSANPDQISTKEVFGELALPIFADAGVGMHELTVTAQFRYSHYDPTGEDWTYNAGAVWAPIPSFSLRGSYARAVRAPTLSELYEPQITGNFPITDPCSVQNIDNGSEFRAANCATLLSEAGVADPASYNIADFFDDPDFTTVDRLFGGNPNVTPEVGDTYTIGFVYQPEYVDGLTMTLDYYDITLTDAIGAADPDFVLNDCVDGSTLNASFCAAAPRGANGVPTSISTVSINIGELKTSGIEGTVSYDWPSSNWGDFSTSVAVSYLDTLTIQTTPNADSTTDLKGLAGTDINGLASSATEWGVNAFIGWTKGRWSSDLGLTYESSGLRVDGGNRNRAIANQLSSHPDVDALYLVTWSGAYDIADNATIRVGMDNVLDQEPYVGELYRPIGPRGRSLYLGFDLDF